MLYTIPNLSLRPFAFTSKTIRRAWKISSIASARSYVTTISKPRSAVTTTTVKTTTALKPKPIRKATKSGGRSKPSAKKSAVKPKPKAKKLIKKKPAPKKRVLSEKSKERLALRNAKSKIRELKETAMYGAEPKQLPQTNWTIYVSEMLANEPALGANRFEFSATYADKFKTLPPAELERITQLAAQNKAANAAAYQTWVVSHTPSRIYDANIARLRLSKSTGIKVASAKCTKILDSRLPKRPTTSFFMFLRDRWASGEYKGLSIPESTKRAKVEFEALSAAEKLAYEQQAAMDKLRYQQEKQTVFQ